MITKDIHGILGSECPVCKKKNMVVLYSSHKGNWSTGDTCKHFKGMSDAMDSFLFEEDATVVEDNK